MLKENLRTLETGQLSDRVRELDKKIAETRDSREMRNLWEEKNRFLIEALGRKKDSDSTIQLFIKGDPEEPLDDFSAHEITMILWKNQTKHTTRTRLTELRAIKGSSVLLLLDKPNGFLEEEPVEKLGRYFREIGLIDSKLRETLNQRNVKNIASLNTLKAQRVERVLLQKRDEKTGEETVTVLENRDQGIEVIWDSSRDGGRRGFRLVPRIHFPLCEGLKDLVSETIEKVPSPKTWLGV